VHPADERPGGLAERLYRMRRTAGLRQQRMAADLGWPTSKISKIENNHQMPAADDIRAWAAKCGHPEQADDLLDLLDDAQTIRRQVRRRMRGGQAPLQTDLDQRARAARHIRDAEVAAIPGLLQTAAYAQSIAAQVAAVYGASDTGAAVEARMRRQEILYDRDRKFEFVITEAALRMPPCPVQVMLGQLDRLLAILDLDNVTLAIIPMNAELAFAPFYGFLILDDAVIIEDYLGENESTAEAAAICHRIFALLMDEAVTGDEARRLIMAAAASLREGSGR
jgi:transcriptional regulator with XRE-family HTH domain